jgi:hypothetical protein
MSDLSTHLGRLEGPCGQGGKGGVSGLGGMPRRGAQGILHKIAD